MLMVVLSLLFCIITYIIEIIELLLLELPLDGNFIIRLLLGWLGQ